MAHRQGLLTGRHLSPVQFKASLILDWIETRGKTADRLDKIRLSLIASGHPEPHLLFPQEIAAPAPKTVSTDEPLPDATPDTTVRYELEAPVEFGEDEYQKLMAEVARNSSGTLTGDDVADGGWI